MINVEGLTSRTLELESVARDMFICGLVRTFIFLRESFVTHLKMT